MSELNRPLKLLDDILWSIDLVEEYIAMVPNEDALEENQEKVDAIARRFGIIGEALYQLQQLRVKVPNRDWAINFRNTLIHQYDATLSETMLARIRKNLPDLRAAV